MITFKSGIAKGGIVLAAGAISTGMAFGQASIFVRNNYLLQNLNLEEEFPPVSQSGTGPLSGFTAENPNNHASASFVTHTFSANSAAQLFVLSNPNGFTGNGPTIAEAGNASSSLSDTVTFNSSGMVVFGLTGINTLIKVSGNLGVGTLLSMNVSSPTIAEGNASEQAVAAGDSQTWNNATQMLQTIPGSSSATTTTSGVNGANYQITNELDNSEMRIAFMAQAGVKYSFFTSIQVATDVDFNSGSASPGLPVGYEEPWGGSPWGGQADVDPMWTLTTQLGQTYTTSSGFQIAGTPEPSSFAAIGIACAGLLLRRRRKA